MVDFPASLPEKAVAQSFKETFGERILSSAVDEGPPKVRLLNTGKPRKIEAEYMYSSAEVETLITFYDGNAANTFNWKHPRTSGTVSVRFTKPPQLKGVGPDLFAVTLFVETVV